MKRLFLLALLIAAPPLRADGDRGRADAIPDALWSAMQGTSWHADMSCPARADLRLLTLPHLDFYGDRREGQLVVAANVAEVMLDIFADMFAAGYPVQSMRPVSAFGGDDDLSMAANNTSAFNCRLVGGTQRLSQHASGRAIDINPVQNPYVTSRGTSPKAGEAYDSPKDRVADVAGVLTPDHPVVKAFKSRGWGWGGDWKNSKDYQHFSENGK